VQKLLIDENLSPSLIGLATANGFVCSHVNHLGLTGKKDWQLKSAISEGDWTSDRYRRGASLQLSSSLRKFSSPE
jgi:hypothetical protein